MKTVFAKLVYVEWVDASIDLGQRPVKDFNPGIKVQSFGYLAVENRRFIVIAQDILNDGHSYRSRMTIPKCMIVKRRCVRNLKRGVPCIDISWRDSHFDRYQELMSETEPKDAIVRTSGIIAAEGREWIAIALSRFPDDHAEYDYVSHIRKDWIVKQRRYRL